jgi:hypothetical protein
VTSSRILLVGVGTTATTSVDLPSVSPSSAPLSGSFTIKCANPDGTTNTTEEIPSTAYPNTISNAINTACPLLRDKYEIWDGFSFNWYTDGRDIYITFT